MKALCDRAASFASKDYFENTTKRRKSCKTLRLADGGYIYAYFVREGYILPRQILYLKSERNKRDTPNSISEENYFQDDRIRQSLSLNRIGGVDERIVLKSLCN